MNFKYTIMVKIRRPAASTVGIQLLHRYFTGDTLPNRSLTGKSRGYVGSPQ